MPSAAGASEDGDEDAAGPSSSISEMVLKEPHENDDERTNKLEVGIY
jgi:hypothetical protein